MTDLVIPLTPPELQYADDFFAFCEEVSALASDRNNDQIRSVRSLVQLPDSPVADQLLRHLLAKSVVIDLVIQGFSVSVDGERAILTKPSSDHMSREEVKREIRRSHVIERDAGLSEGSVAAFVQSMEKIRLTKNGWHSIFSLMRDGRELAGQLSECLKIEDSSQYEDRLSEIVKPYIEFVEPNQVCNQTGLYLQDIWRYFRLTWTNVYKSLPGRSIQILIRDGAAKNHPVIGIAALGSAVVQQSHRDNWIGWSTDRIMERIATAPPRGLTRWLANSLDELIDSLFVVDLREEQFVSGLDLRYPTANIIKKLREESERAIEQHRHFPSAASHKKNDSADGRIDWEKQARTKLFRSKRCALLADLLEIKASFQEHGLYSGKKSSIAADLEDRKFSDAVARLIRRIKSERVGANMMDIVVCGSIAPYNHLLGGKLVCSMMFSPELVRHYKAKYGDQESVIASSMKGAPVVKPSELVLLSTTSLYAGGSSQYNRIKIPISKVEVGGVGELAFEELGETEGYGSFHFGATSLKLVELVLARSQNYRKVNSIFGEGVNPLMRKLRDALSEIRFPSDAILKHGNSRVVYGVPLATNFRDYLIGIASKPQFLLPQKSPKRQTENLASYWRRRWLSGRITRPGILASVAGHSVAFPIRHGARVRVDHDEQDEGRQASLWDEMVS